MSVRSVALLAGLVGGLLWLARMVLSLTGTGEGAEDLLSWGGLALLALALAGFGVGLASTGPLWLRGIVAVAFPLGVWSVLEVLHPAGDPAVIDGVLAAVVLLVSVQGLVRDRTAAPEQPVAHHEQRAQAR